jgi:hypothetical protein
VSEARQENGMPSFSLEMFNRTVVKTLYNHTAPALQSAVMPDALPCTLSFHGLSLPDLSLFVTASYLPRSSPDFSSFVSSYLDGWTFKDIERADDSPVSFYDFYSEARNVSVVAIKASWLVSVICRHALIDL